MRHSASGAGLSGSTSGDIPVEIVSHAATIKYNEVLLVANGIETDVVSYIVPVGKKAWVQNIQYFGQNSSIFRIKINNVIYAKEGSYFTSFFGNFKFAHGNERGLLLSASDQIKLTAQHSRPTTSDYNGSIVIIEL